MTRPTFRPDPRRDAVAAELATSAYCWPVVTLKRDVNAFRAGEVFYGVPSSDGVTRYVVNERACDCPDYQGRGSGCKHQRAVALHLAALEAAEGAAIEVAHADMLEGADAIRAAFGHDAGLVVRTFGPTRYDALYLAEG